MTRVEAEGLSANCRMTAAANEEFAGTLNRREGAITKLPGGWDPYEVWLTRVKGPAKARKEHQRDDSQR